MIAIAQVQAAQATREEDREAILTYLKAWGTEQVCTEHAPFEGSARQYVQAHRVHEVREIAPD